MDNIQGDLSQDALSIEKAVSKLEQLRKKGTVIDDDAELASYREEKYGDNM